MTQKELLNALIDEMVERGETFLGTYEVQGEKVLRLYKKVSKEVEKRYEGMIVCWDAETGMAWMA